MKRAEVVPRFEIDVIGGPDGGGNLYTLDGFDADAHGGRRTTEPILIIERRDPAARERGRISSF